jgi:hypothetical protein
LKTSSDLKCRTKIDLEKIYMDQKAYDKMRLEYVEIKFHSLSKNIGSQKNGSILKNKKIKNIKDNRRKHKHEYEYKYTLLHLTFSLIC